MNLPVVAEIGTEAPMGDLMPAREARSLASLDEARRAISLAVAAKDTDGLLEWRERAAAVQHYARRREDAKAIADDAGEIKVRAEAALGRLDAEAAPHGGKREQDSATGNLPLADVRTETRAAWRKLGTVNGNLDELLARLRADENTGITTAGALRILAATKDKARKERSTAERNAKRAEDATAATLSADLHHGPFADHTHTLADGSVTLLLTDPPYGADYRSAYRWASTTDPIIGDQNPEHALAALADALTIMEPKLAADAHLLVFCRWREEPEFRATIEAAGWTLRSRLIWVKNEPGMGDLTHAFGPMHESVLHATRGDARMRYREGDCLTCPRVSGGHHPTEKPVELLKRLVRATTNPGDLVADPFAGVASTLLAAEQTGRHGWGCEIHPDYYAHGTERLAAAAS